MPEVVAEIVKGLTSIALEGAEETLADCLERLGDGGPEITYSIPPLVPPSKFIPAIQNALNGVEEGSDSSIHDISHRGPHFSGALEVAEDCSEDGGPSRTKCLGRRVDQLRESLHLRSSIVRDLSKPHDFVGLFLRVAGIQELFTRQITGVLGECLDHDL